MLMLAGVIATGKRVPAILIAEFHGRRKDNSQSLWVEKQSLHSM
jgi:hypothetical protein